MCACSDHPHLCHDSAKVTDWKLRDCSTEKCPPELPGSQWNISSPTQRQLAEMRFSIADTTCMFIEEASGNRSSTACRGQRKACSCSAHETDHQRTVLWRYDLCTAAKGMKTWYYEKQLSLSTSYFCKTKMTENAQQICCSQLFHLFSLHFPTIPISSLLAGDIPIHFPVSSNFASFRSGYRNRKPGHERI